MHNKHRYLLRLLVHSSLAHDTDTPAKAVSNGYDYWSAEDVPIGSRVIVPFGDANKQVMAIVSETPKVPSVDPDTLKQVAEVVSAQPCITQNYLAMTKQVARYYRTSHSTTLFALLPKTLVAFNAKKNDAPPAPVEVLVDSTVQAMIAQLELTPPQTTAYQSISRRLRDEPQVLFIGPTGSGKTRVYLRLAIDMVAQGKQVLLLAPEITLVDSIALELKKITTLSHYRYHSSRPAKEKKQLIQLLLSGQPCLVLGTRSAIGLPFAKLGAIIIDEEQDHARIKKNALCSMTQER